LCLLYGWGKRGEPLVQRVPARRGKNLSVLGAIDQEGVIAFTSKEGAMKRADVERFFKRDLLPALLPGSVVVLDNASIHQGGTIQKIVERAGCKLLYLPPYSPDLNPIEPVWSVVKRQVRREGPREEAARLASVHTGMESVTPKLAEDCFRHCGYCQ